MTELCPFGYSSGVQIAIISYKSFHKFCNAWYILGLFCNLEFISAVKAPTNEGYDKLFVHIIQVWGGPWRGLKFITVICLIYDW